MKEKHLDRAERTSQILMVFINDYKLGKVDELTATQVARALMLSPSWHIRRLLAKCVADGDLVMRGMSDARCNNLPETEGQKYWYKLSDEKKKEIDEQARDIPLKIKGVTVGQLRLI